MLIIKCKKCGIEKPESDFSIFRGRRNKSCIKCRTKNNGWYANDKRNRKTKAKEYYRRIKNKVAQYRSDLRLDRKYKLTRQEWNNILAEQNNQCGICKIDFNKVEACVDHNHITGEIRGLLCRRCNLELQVIENTDFLKKAQTYLDSMK